MHRPRTLLGERLNDQVREAWASVDLIGLCLPADQEIGPGDLFIATHARTASKAPLIAIVTKVDAVSRDALASVLLAVQQFGDVNQLDFVHIIPVSAQEGFQVDRLTKELIGLLPEGPRLYPEEASGDEEIEITVAELIREAALQGVTEELPHSIAVVVEEIVPREGRPADKPLSDVRATVFVERDSQKGIVIGTGGSRLRHVGAQARPEIERLLGVPVFLDLHVKVARDWQRDPKQLRRLGF
jgi:GTP-binding protein Era